ncbi:MAG: acyloxyacyl hydrolase [Thermodesulfobacteriota bacterium]
MRKFFWLLIILSALPFALSSVALAGDTAIDNFGKGKRYMGFLAGYGSGFSLGFSGNGDGHEVEYLATFPYLGLGISNLKAENKWYRGNFDLIVEGEFIRSFEPNDGFSAGVNFIVRYNLLSWNRFVPFAEAGTGIGFLDFDLVDQEDGFIFYPQAGLGFHYFLTGLFSVDTSLRFHHISNAGTNQPNNGIHSGLVLLGVTFYLD